jgi:hypothetical protein
MPFSSEKNWTNVQSSRPKKRKWEEGEGANQERTEELQAGVNKPVGQVLSEAWDNLKKIPGEVKKGWNKK